MASVLTPHLHTGFSLRAGLEDAEAGWSPELIASLDWMRLAELLRAVAAHSGCELGPSRVSVDGSVQFAMVQNAKGFDPQRSLVKLVPWNHWGCTPEAVQAFSSELSRIREKCRGVLVAPDGFTAAACQQAQNMGIETVDAQQLYRIIAGLRPDQADFFFTVTTAGSCRVPTCPVCLRKLSRVEQPATRALRATPGEMVFTSSTLVPDPIACGRLEVMRNCEVTFLNEVRTRELVVHGDVSGDFIVEGPFILQPGATLTGTIAARSIKVHDGGELRGQFRVLDGVTEAIKTMEPKWFWRCLNDSGRNECRSVMFEPHG